MTGPISSSFQNIEQFHFDIDKLFYANDSNTETVTVTSGMTESTPKNTTSATLSFSIIMPTITTFPVNSINNNSNSPEQQPKSIIIPLIASLCIAVLIIVAGLVLYIFRFRKRKREHHTRLSHSAKPDEIPQGAETSSSSSFSSSSPSFIVPSIMIPDTHGPVQSVEELDTLSRGTVVLTYKMNL